MRFLLQHTSQVATISIDHHTRTIPHGAVVYVSFHQDDNNNYITKIDTFIQKIQTTKRFRLPDSDKISASLSDT
jgi:D-Tyr-tRNAtyr deacylase